MSSKAGKKETLSKQSAAQFFSEHQQIAGFDNPGKSLFTTIREFVENSLDAAESMHVLPEIELCIEEFSETEHNSVHGICTNSNSNLNLVDLEQDPDDEQPATKSKGKASKESNKEPKEQMYYLIRCVDNGCGIAEENIGDMLGRVLSGSKHGIRQTRGKFGLGAKMVRLLTSSLVADVSNALTCSTGINLVQEVVRPADTDPDCSLR
jgi:DNA topoisomerase-6 subunit B